MESTSPQKIRQQEKTSYFTENDNRLVSPSPIEVRPVPPPPPPIVESQQSQIQSAPSDSGLMTPEEEDELLLEEGEIADDSMLMEYEEEIDPALTANLRHESEKTNAWTPENLQGEKRYTKELMDLIGKLPGSNREPDFVQKFKLGDANFAFVQELFAEVKRNKKESKNEFDIYFEPHFIDQSLKFSCFNLKNNFSNVIFRSWRNLIDFELKIFNFNFCFSVNPSHYPLVAELGPVGHPDRWSMAVAPAVADSMSAGIAKALVQRRRRGT